jgi:negative regulator of flagellin synthesis FlgM
MAIKISTPLQTAHVAKTSSKEKAGNTENVKQQSVKQTDSLKFTETAQELKQALTKLESVPVVNAERVKEARDAISAGTYTIDADEIAEKMIQIEQSLSDDT